MSKTVIQTLLLASLVSASTAQAQSKVSVYGRLNLGLVHYSGYGLAGTTLTSQNNLASRIGFKGVEELGNGLSAFFVIESSLSPDTGSGTIGGREASLGLQGNFGKLRLGYMLTPLDDFHSVAGPGWVTNVSNDNQNGFWGNGYSNINNGDGKACNGSVAGTDSGNNFSFDNRYGNSLRYDSPVFKGLSFASHISLAESSATGCRNAYASSSKFQYADQDFIAGVAYNYHHNARGPDLHDHLSLFSAGYKLGKRAYLGAYFQDLHYANPGKRALSQQGYGIIGKLYQGATSFELGYYRAGAGSGDQTPVFSGVFVGDGSAADLTSLGARHALSKQTDLWVQALYLRNGSRADYVLGGFGKAGGSGNPGQARQALAMGIKYDF
jgi:predicted porin